MTNWAQMFNLLFRAYMNMCMYVCWDTTSEETGLCQLPKAYLAFKATPTVNADARHGCSLYTFAYNLFTYGSRLGSERSCHSAMSSWQVIVVLYRLRLFLKFPLTGLMRLNTLWQFADETIFRAHTSLPWWPARDIPVRINPAVASSFSSFSSFVLMLLVSVWFTEYLEGFCNFIDCYEVYIVIHTTGQWGMLTKNIIQYSVGDLLCCRWDLEQENKPCRHVG